MSRNPIFRTLAAATLCQAALLAAAGSGEVTPLPRTPHGIMRPDFATRRRWEIQARLALRQERAGQIKARAVRAGAAPLPAQFSLLSKVPDYRLRNQENCGSCWVWSSTALAEVELNRVFGITDRLSVQYLQSNDLEQAACAGGSLTEFCNWYMAAGGSTSNQHPGTLVPWSNPNGGFVDGAMSSYQTGSVTPPDGVGMTPAYTGLTFTHTTLATDAVAQEDAISSIQEALYSGQAVGFSFDTNFSASDGFYNFWDNTSENILWTNPYEGKTWGSGWGGHMVTIVGWDASDSNPASWYWIALNQWGTSNRRPNGLFHLPMKLNYQATWSDGKGGTYDCYRFETLTLAGTRPQGPEGLPAVTLPEQPGPFLAGQSVDLVPLISGGQAPMTYQWQTLQDGAWTDIPGATGSTLNLPDGVTPHAGVLDATWSGRSFAVKVTNPSGTSRTATTLQVAGSVLTPDAGLEDGATTTDWTWSLTPDFNPIFVHTPLNDADDATHSGSCYARLTGFGHGGATGTFTSRPVVLPSDPSVPVYATYYLAMESAERDAQVKGSCTLQVVDPDGNVLQLLKTHTNEDVDHLTYRAESFDITALNQGGTPVAIQAVLSDPDSTNSIFRLDDVQIVTGTRSACNPAIASITPGSGTGCAFPGTEVTITGSNLSGASLVMFGRDYANPLLANTDTSITVNVPWGAATGPVTVVTPHGTATSSQPFYAAPALIDSTFTADGQEFYTFPSYILQGTSQWPFFPVFAAVGDPVTVYGFNFTGATGVSVGDVPATDFHVTSNSGLTFTVPAGSRTAPLTITTPGGSVTSTRPFTVTTPPPAPQGTGFSPLEGFPGTDVTITGTLFNTASAVTIGGSPVPFVLVSDTLIHASVPVGAVTGPVAVTTAGGTWTSTASFTVNQALPAVTTFEPASGTVGTSVTITGRHLTGATSVAFNGASAPFTLLSDTSLVARVPAEATSGPVTVTSAQGPWTSSDPFQVVPTLAIPAQPDCLLVGATYLFTAVMTGASDPSVTWSVQEGAAGGTVDALGRYVAPAVPGTYHVVATSAADGSLTATATVPVRFGTLTPGRTPSGELTVTDLAYLMGAMGARSGALRYAAGADFDGDGIIDLQDLTLFLGSF